MQNTHIKLTLLSLTLALAIAGFSGCHKAPPPDASAPQQGKMSQADVVAAAQKVYPPQPGYAYDVLSFTNGTWFVGCRAGRGVLPVAIIVQDSDGSAMVTNVDPNAQQ